MKENDLNSDSTQKIPRLKKPEKKLIPIVCSWCKKIYKLSEWNVEHNKKTGISHGICEECLKKFEREQKK
ncbi:MAG TPA: hypothetical protein P5105_00945 [Victivallales bacterium]|nr:hypothetical protein [Victivallales bacterium]HPO89981.1 hypothetical protein [Victivallales bacterium]HRR05825.1 hypothetical protein [Victivallales bacterium]HRR28737.1 hypothetical protein [Victivallales bacterium]HRU01229.1 hypothetical protein [Victivallales bacterium]